MPVIEPFMIDGASVAGITTTANEARVPSNVALVAPASCDSVDLGLAESQVPTSRPHARRNTRWRRVAALFVAALGGAGLYRTGEELVVRGRQASAGHAATNRFHTFPDGTMNISPALADVYPIAMKYLLQAPGAQRVHDKLRSTLPELYDNELLVEAGPTSAFGHQTNTLTWDPSTKTMFPVGAKNGVGFNSAAAALDHEFKHALHYRENRAAFLLRRALPDPTYDNLEERLTVLEANADTPFLNHESNRTDHHSAILAHAQSVTDTSAEGFPANATAIMTLRERFYSDATAYRHASVMSQFAAQQAEFFEAAASDPVTFNQTVLAGYEQFADEGDSLTTAYADATRHRTVPADIVAAVEHYREAASAFAASVVPRPRPAHKPDELTLLAEPPASAERR